MSYSAATYQVYRGDNRTLRVSIVDATGAAIDTTSWTVDFTLRQTAGAATALITKTSATPGEIDAVDAANGIWDIKLLPADTDLPAVTYTFDVQVTTDDATPKIFTVLVDTIEVLQDVTRP